MFSKVFLAQTGREMEEFQPERTAYMACHFSPYSKGLSNSPLQLPQNSILLLDDSMPVQGHDAKVVAEQLQTLIDRFSVCAVLLDFQREQCQEAQEMASRLVQTLSCHVAVTQPYTVGNCPVFLAPPPVNMPLEAYLAPWLKRGVYLELAPEALQITVTNKGSSSTSLPFDREKNLPLEDKKQHCHYHVEVFPDRAVFTLQRGKKDLASLAEEAYRLGVHGAVGLYQELSKL